MTEETLFHEALSRPANERAAFLDAACAGQPELRAAVESLLAAHEASRNVLDATVDSEPGRSRTDVTVDHSEANTPTATRSVTQAGEVIAGRYTLVEKIGEGGMGEVWVAQQTEPVKRRVALKLIKSGMDSSSVLARFEQERQALALMDHPNIARVLDGGVTPNGQPFFVMELVNGLPLTRFCDEMKLTPRERLELFIPICQAVQHAHQKGIVHRDLKPANILVTVIDGKPVPKVIDFGVAKATGGSLTEEEFATHFGAVVGTLEYMSPEQAGYSGVDVDTRADVYSLGVILYELLTGLRPIDSKRLQKAGLVEMIRVIQEVEPARPSTRLSTEEALPSLAATRQTDPRKLMAILRGELDWVVMKCLEKERARRYESASDLAKDVQRYLSDEPVEARPPSFGYRLRKTLQRNRLVVATILAIAASLLLGLGLAIWQAIVATEARNNAVQLADEKSQLADANAVLATKESQAKEKALQATAAREEQLQRTRAVLFTSQMERVTPVLEHDPLAALTLLQDTQACPIDLRDLAWGYARNASLRRHLPDAKLVASTDCVFSDDGKWVACIPFNGSGVDVRAFPSGDNRFDFTPMGERVKAMLFGSTGDHLALATDKNLVHWFDLTTGEQLATLEGHTGAIRALACSSDGRFLATGSVDGTARIWDLATGATLHTLRDHGKEVAAVAFHPDGKRLATGGHDHTIRLWDVESGKPLATWKANGDADSELFAWRESERKFGFLPPADEGVVQLDFSPDGKSLVSASTNWLIEVRDVDSGVVRTTVREVRHPTFWLRFHPDGANFLTHGRNRAVPDQCFVERWDTKTGQKLARHRVGSANDVAGYCQGRNLLVAMPRGLNSTWTLYDLDAPPERARLVAEKVRGWLAHVLFSPDGKSLVASGGDRIFVRDVPTGQLRHTLIGHKGIIYGLALAPDGRTLASSCAASRPNVPADDVRLWDIVTGQALGTIELGERLAPSLAFSPDGKSLAVLHRPPGNDLGRTPPVVGVFNVPTRDHRFDLSPTDTGVSLWSGTLGKVAFNPRDGSLICATGRAMTVWDLETRKERTKMLLTGATETYGGEFAGLAVHPDGKFIATSHLAIRGGNELCLWDVATGARIESRRNAGEIGIAFSPDGRNLLTTRERFVEVWDSATLQQRASIPAHEQTGYLGLAVSPDGRTLATGSLGAGSRYRLDDNEAALEVRLWDVGVPPVKIVLEAASNIRFSPDRRTLVERDSRGLLRFWDLETGTLAKAVDVTQHRMNVQFSPDGRYLVGHDVPLLDGNKWASTSVDSTRYRDRNCLLNLLDTRTYTIRQFEVGKGAIVSSTFSPDGKRLALVHDRTQPRAQPLYESSLEIWNVEESRSERTIPFPTHQLSIPPAFSPDGRLVAVGGILGSEEYGLSVLNVEDGTTLASLREPRLPNRPYPMNRLLPVFQFEDNGKRLVLRRNITRKVVQVWDWTTGMRSEEPDIEPPFTGSVSPDGRYEIRTLSTGREVIDRTVKLAEVVSHRRRP